MASTEANIAYWRRRADIEEHAAKAADDPRRQTCPRSDGGAVSRVDRWRFASATRSLRRSSTRPEPRRPLGDERSVCISTWRVVTS